MDELKKHSYDGIQEYDNPLPSWWLWTFFFTIIFAFIYYVHYEIAGGPTLQDELKVAMQELEKNKAAQPQVMETEDSIAEAMNGAGMIETGAAQYVAKCAACHGNELQGSIGPNLTDKFWIHGKATRLDVVKVIREGVADKGMPPWGPVMKKEEIYAVSAYIMSKIGTNPPNPKAPQEEEVP